MYYFATRKVPLLRHRVTKDPVSPSRRDFLIRSSQGAAAAFLPASLGSIALAYPAPQPAEFHLHPHYRAKTPLDTFLLNTQSGSDQFITEKYQDQIAALLSEWRSSLLQSPHDIRVLEKLLAADFFGSPFRPSESKQIRSGSPVEVHHNTFALPTLAKDAFLQDWRASLSTFSKVLTAEFQITRIDAFPNQFPEKLNTRVRYELVGTGPNFHREQRIGEWDLEWQFSTTGEFHLQNWHAFGETRTRSASPVYADITASAFAASASYSSQLLRGADHWRTILDVACGIDIYGHNGISLGDMNGNGLDDLYICQPAGLPNRLYRNRGDGTFEDVTEASGLGLMENTACALFADISNNGHQDLIVVRTDGPQLFLNDGKRNFRVKPNAFHFATPPQGTFTGAAIADFDRDGWLDIYFCLYLYYQGADQYKYPSPYFDAQNGPPNFLMKNNRDGTFRDVTAESGLNQNNTRYSFCCGWSDFNNDGWPDLYVVNDFGRKNLYRNNGDGTFADIAPQAGVEDIGAGMGVCVFDYDNDGNQDLYVANMWTAAGERISAQDAFQKEASPDVRAHYQKHAMGNSLFRNKNNGTFQDASSSSGTQMGRWAWSSDAWDYDHDGFSDLYIANGMVSGLSQEDLNSFFWRQVVANSPNSPKPTPDYEHGWNALNELLRSDGTWSGYERNVFYANNGDVSSPGASFSDISGAIGLDFPEDGRAFALADFDGDGRLEVFLKNRNAPQLRLLKNVMQDLPPSIAFRLRGTKSNRDAIGAVVTLETSAGRQTRSLQAGSGFLSQHTKEIFFGLGNAQGAFQASILWPSGLLQKLHDLPANHRVWVEEGANPTRIEPFQAVAHANAASTQEVEPLPTHAETWLLSPVSAPEFTLPGAAGKVRTLASLRGQGVLLEFFSGKLQSGPVLSTDSALISSDLAVIAVNCDANDSGAASDTAAIYNLLYRYLFDRHRDLTLPTSFLIDNKGEIVKLYQGAVRAEQVIRDYRDIPQTAAQRLAKALPFPVVTAAADFRRNYLSLGSVFFQRGYYEQSEASFRTAVAQDPKNAEAHYGLGSACLKIQKIGEARAHFEQVTTLHATYPDTLPNAWNNLGLLATQEGNTAAAIPFFEEALRLNSEHFIALVNLGNAYRQQKQWDDARKTLARALTTKPDDPEANYSLGMVYAQLDDTAQAFDYLQKALKSRPDYPEALNNLGVLYLRTRRRDEAVASFEECIRVAPAFDQSYLNVARVYALEGDAAKARAVLVALLKQRPGHAQAQNALAALP